MKAVPVRFAALVGALLGACATAEPGADERDGGDLTPADSHAVDSSSLDGAPEPDGPEPSPDARIVDARQPDAAVSLDSGACTITTIQLLSNPSFDAAPMGSGWSQAPSDPTYPLVTDADGIVEDTAPYKAWLGGIEDGVDSLHQDVAVPAGTTALTLRGKYEVRTAEWLPGTYDQGYVELTSTSGAVLESVLSVSDDAATTSWTSFSRQFTGNYGGQTVRVRFRATNDGSDTTSFYFDSLALDAVACR